MHIYAAHILVPTLEQAIALKEKLKEGANFNKLAADYSKCPSAANGGYLGFFGKEQMVKPFEEAAYSTPVGGVSEPVKTQFGYHLIKRLY